MPFNSNNLKLFSLASGLGALGPVMIVVLAPFVVPASLHAAITFSEARTRTPDQTLNQSGTLIQSGTESDSDSGLSKTTQQLILDATASIELNPSIESGLSSGVPLYFNATIEISRSNRWWPDTTLHKQVRRYSLVYYVLTRHYRVSWLDESRSRNFRSLLDALESIGMMRDLPLQLDEALQPGETYRARVNLALDQNALPLALRPVAFVNSAWRLESEEFQWQIN